MSKVVKVSRTIVIKYTTLVEHYPGMTEAEIIEWEQDPDNVTAESILDDVVSDTATAWIEDEP